MGDVIIVGLGNPGPQYELTRHNLGFLVLDFFNDKYIKKTWREKYRGLYADGVIEENKVRLLKPLTFMNNSGESVKRILKDIEDPQLVVVHDDLDLDFGKVKLKFDGSDGGHRGIRSIIMHIGSKEFWRLKMGIGREGSNVVDYVLSIFSREQFDFLGNFVELGSEVLYSFIVKGPAKTMSEFNGKSVINT